MKILMISDTHGNMSMIDKMVKIAVDFDLTIHLGDNYPDGIPFIESNISIIRVPGTWGWEYQDNSIDNRRFETFLGWRFFLTHTPTSDPHDLDTDIDPEDVLKHDQCDLFCHGHTHKPIIYKAGHSMVLNPGHLKSSFDRGHNASYAQIELSELKYEITIIELESGKVIHSFEAFKS
jgi:putative phosphoesterase